jgi:bifunctional enzyme CysN/CysC
MPDIAGNDMKLPPAEDFEAYLHRNENKDLLRFITCGSVDDGKSTLIGRLLYDSQQLFDDQLSALEKDSTHSGSVSDGGLDFSLLVDGLAAEREQGITIDVAYRFFATDKRKFIVADTPGHEQYTRNMATGASTADLAVLLIDARKGVLEQTRRHSFIVSLMGIRDVVLAINKMDLVEFDQKVFDAIVADYRQFAQGLGIRHVTAIPMSARNGDNITGASENTPWYKGEALLPFLETVRIERPEDSLGLRFPVQWVNRPNLDFRGYSGTIAAGSVRRGDTVTVLPGGRTSQVTSIVTQDGELEAAGAGEAVTLTLAHEIDISRGSVIASGATPVVAEQAAAHILWMAPEPMLPGRFYELRLHSQSAGVQISEIKHKINVNSLEKLAAKKLELNELGVCNLTLDRPLVFDPYSQNRMMGGFIIVDRLTNATVGCGTLDFALRRDANVHWQQLEVDRRQRAALKGQKPAMLWFTGLSGAGKSTVANLVEKKLFSLGRHAYVLDGDNIRHGLSRDLGFTDEDRVENIRRAAEAARLFVDAGMIVLVSFISPFRSERQMARGLVAPGEFIEVYVSTPRSECEKRDPKGLYAKARAGELPHFTGLDSSYEPPENAEIELDTCARDPETLADEVITYLREQGII